jgi:citrate synthase
VSFEEVAYLLWYGALPSRSQYEALRKEIGSAHELPESVMAALKELAPRVEGMHALRIGVAMLSVNDSQVDVLDPEAWRKRAMRMQAQVPAIIAHTWRIKNGLPVVEPKSHHGIAQSFLYMLEGEEPAPARVDALNAYLVAVSEHGFNASTFTGRVVVSTDSDMVSALTAAVGALKGPKHGGVPGPVLTMLQKIGTPDNAEPYIRNEITSGRRIMGFGHRVYKVRDPRAALLSDASRRMAEITGDHSLLDLTEAVEQTTVKVLSELKPGRELYANVELYAALVLHAIGVPSELFTPVFAIGRTAGWTAHMVEQVENNRIMRPNAHYTGPRGLKWQPMEQRPGETIMKED